MRIILLVIDNNQHQMDDVPNAPLAGSGENAESLIESSLIIVSQSATSATSEAVAFGEPALRILAVFAVKRLS